MNSIDIVGLGACTIDILSIVNHFPNRDETLPAIGMAMEGGGPVATAVFTAAKLGARTAMIDTIGDDWRGRLILEGFESVGVSTSAIQVIPNLQSRLSNILVREIDGARAIIYSSGNTPDPDIKDLPVEAIQSARIFHINGRYLSACLQSADWARQAGVLVSFDGGTNHYRPEIRQLVPLSDVCIVARNFAFQYTGESEFYPALEALLAEGPRLAVITDGENGSWILQHGEKIHHQPAFKVDKVIDTTGCGDSYHGAFLYGISRGYSATQSALLASAVAALTARHLGGWGGLPTLREAEEFIKITAL